MKIFTRAVLAAFFVGLLFSNALSAGYGSSYKGPSREMMPPESAVPMRQEAGAEYFAGTLSGIISEKHQIVVNTEVPGLLGAQTRDVPFTLDRDSTVTVCFKSINSCDGLDPGEGRWQTLASLEGLDSFNKVDRNAIVVGDPESDRIVHVQIEYGI